MRRSLGRQRLRVGAVDRGCPKNGGSWHVAAPLNNWQLGSLIRSGFSAEQLERYVCCRLCDRMGPPELVRSRPALEARP